MKGWCLAAFVLLVTALAVSGPAAAAKPVKGGVALDQYEATVDQATYRSLLDQGIDVVSADDVEGGGVRIALVLSKEQAQALRRDGVQVKPQKNAFGRTARQEAAAQATGGFAVWRDYDSPGGMRAYLYEVARQNPQIATLEVIGRSVQGREILALRLTQGGKGVKAGTRPAVLYSALQHAREWIAGEVDRRLLAWYVSRWRANDKAIKDLLKSTELWFVLVANPDGYQYTHASEDTRLWRKTLRDNNGNGTVEVGDGVDPNRNFDAHWNYDEEGSSSVLSSETYRGTGPASEPETQAMAGLLSRIRFEFQVNYHSAGRWILYPEGWQIGSPTADDPIYFALSGNLDNPAIGSPATGDGFHPGLSSDVLYVTNGETTDYSHTSLGTLAWTPELSEGCPGCGFVFPDDEALVEQEFQRNLPFALDVAKSAVDPDDPVSHLGIRTKPLYVKSDDTYKTGLPLANFTFAYSYGDPQEVRVIAKRAIGAVTLKYQIGSGPVQSRPTAEWNGGEKYGAKTDVYYRIMRGVVTGTNPGDSVKVWFEGGGAASESFTYQALSETGRRVLVLAAEDYSGQSPGPPYSATPLYLSYYLDALAANGIAADVYDVDARGRQGPSNLGVLSHYDAVVWYTGEDVVPREPGWGGGNASRLAMDEMLNVRDYLNEGGRVMYTGKHAGEPYTTNLGAQLYDPTAANMMCRGNPTLDARRCLALSGSGDNVNDVVEYWFGAYLVNSGAGVNEDTGEIYDVDGVDTPFTALHLAFNGADSADNQDNANSFISTSGILPPATYPQFRSWPSAKYDRPGGPFDPHTGEFYVYSQLADVTYKRLTRTISVPAGGATLSFWTSYNTEHDWDYTFVEAHTAGSDADWTTLPDLNGNNSQDVGPPTPPGGADAASCAAGWGDLHPHLDHYQTNNGDGTCSPTGSTGEWWAAGGNSGGWQEWEVDLSEWAGKQVEVSIAYASDWSVQGLGVFVDDATITTPAGTTSTSFETGLDGWAVTGPPPGSAPNANNFVRTDARGFPEGAAITTDDTLYLGFGLEGVRGAAQRAALMDRAIDYLLR